MSKELWEQRSDEGAKAFEAFRAFCEFGEGRSVARICEELGKPENLLRRWSERHQWPQRAAAYDDDQAKPRQLWELQHGETTTAYAAFAAYRDMGKGRSLRSLSDQLGKGYKQLAEWSSRHSWVSRIEAWELDQDRQNRELRKDQLRNMNERHARAGQLFYSAAMERLVGNPEKGIAPLDRNKMTTAETLALAKLAVEMERGALTQAQFSDDQDRPGPAIHQTVIIVPEGATHNGRPITAQDVYDAI